MLRARPRVLNQIFQNLVEKKRDRHLATGRFFDDIADSAEPVPAFNRPVHHRTPAAKTFGKGSFPAGSACPLSPLLLPEISAEPSPSGRHAIERVPGANIPAQGAEGTA